MISILRFKKMQESGQTMGSFEGFGSLAYRGKSKDVQSRRQQPKQLLIQLNAVQQKYAESSHMLTFQPHSFCPSKGH